MRKLIVRLLELKAALCFQLNYSGCINGMFSSLGLAVPANLAAGALPKQVRNVYSIVARVVCSVSGVLECRGVCVMFFLIHYVCSGAGESQCDVHVHSMCG